MFDYTMEMEELDGTVKKVQYQQLIRALKIENEEMIGKPLTAGGVPQVEKLSRLLELKWNLKAVRVYFNGNQIL